MIWRVLRDAGGNVRGFGPAESWFPGKQAGCTVTIEEDCPALPVEPDPVGFEGALKTILADPLIINNLMKKYPLFLWSLRGCNWAYVEQLLIGAKTAADLTQQQYDAIKAAAVDKSIPLTLP
jgi:hypothetical protein